MGRTGSALCPVAVILAYLAIHPGTPGGPLFIYSDGSPLSRDRLIAAVRRALAEAGVGRVFVLGRPQQLLVQAWGTH